MSVRRAEFNSLIDLLNERGQLLNRFVEEQQQMLKEQQIQFQRIAQIQAELDSLKQAWTRLKSKM